MLFPTHLAAAYLVGRRWELPAGWTVAGAALPDLLDKSAAAAGLVPLYHSAGHSLAALAGLFVVAYLRESVTPLWIGWATHLPLDALHMLLNGRPADVLFLAWPAISHTPAVNLPPLPFAAQYVGTPSFYLEVAIWTVVAGVAVRERRTE